jgi:hypothetical protein
MSDGFPNARPRFVTRAAMRLMRFCEQHDRLLEIQYSGDTSPSLRRAYLLFKDKLRPGDRSRDVPVNLFLHQFLESDPLDLHDHPWSYLSIILSGGYWNVTPDARTWYGPGRILFRRADQRHRVELDPHVPTCFTLVLRGPRTREWGYWKNGQWKMWREYLGL